MAIVEMTDKKIEKVIDYELYRSKLADEYFLGNCANKRIAKMINKIFSWSTIYQNRR